MKADENKTTISRFSTITKYLGRYRLYLVVGAVAIIGANALMLVPPYLTKLIFVHNCICIK